MSTTKLLCLLLAPLPLCAAVSTGWIGTYTSEGPHVTGSAGIYGYRWDDVAGSLEVTGVAAETPNPSFMTVHPNGRWLYATNEDVSPSGKDRVSAFRIESAAPGVPPRLKLINTLLSEGSAPCHVNVDRTGRWLLLANFYSGNLAVFPIAANGALGEPVQVVQQHRTDPPRGRQDNAFAHQVMQTPDGRHLLVVDLGADRIFIYRFDARTGHITPHEPAFVALPPGTGPRHIVMSRDTRFVYAVAEIDPSVVTLRFDAAANTLRQVAATSTLPAGYTGRRSGAEIALHPNGRFLYASNRGDSNSIAIFRIGPDGIPQPQGHVSTGGQRPRYFRIDPSGRFLLVANQSSDEIVVLAIDQDTGALTPRPGGAKVPSPVMMLDAPAAR